MTTTTEPNTTAEGAPLPLPAPAEFQPTSVDYVADPHPVLRRMREEGRVHQVHSHLGPRLMLTHYDDVDALLKSRDVFKDVRKLAPDDPRRLGVLPQENPRADAQPSILGLDDPEHGRLRRLVNAAFTPRAVEALTPHIAEIADTLLDAVAGEDEIDVMAALAIPLPVIVISEMLGVDPDDRDRFKHWSLTMVNSELHPDDHDRIRAGRAARAAMREYFDAVVTARRAAPRDDLISALVLAEQDGDRLSHDETLTMLGLLLNAGNLTTTDLLGNGLLALLSHPREYQRLRERPELIANAVEEMLRYTPPVLGTGRITAKPQQVGGCPVGANVSVTGSVIAANRDPAVFERPDEFDVTRDSIRHLSFGGGIHFCLGANLARNEARVALERLFARYDRIELAIRPEEAEWRGGGAFRGLERLPLRVHARA
jgi:cytochrome P450